MDWVAKMFGLHSVFWNVNKVGGGVIQVRWHPMLLQVPRAHRDLNLFMFLPRLPRLIRLSPPSSPREQDTSMPTRA